LPELKSFLIYALPHPGPLPQERGKHLPPRDETKRTGCISRLARRPRSGDCNRPTQINHKCRYSLPLLGERAGVRAGVNTYIPDASVFSQARTGDFRSKKPVKPLSAGFCRFPPVSAKGRGRVRSAEFGWGHVAKCRNMSECVTFIFYFFHASAAAPGASLLQCPCQKHAKKPASPLLPACARLFGRNAECGIGRELFGLVRAISG